MRLFALVRTRGRMGHVGEWNTWKSGTRGRVGHGEEWNTGGTVGRNDLLSTIWYKLYMDLVFFPMDSSDNFFNHSSTAHQRSGSIKFFGLLSQSLIISR